MPRPLTIKIVVGYAIFTSVGLALLSETGRPEFLPTVVQYIGAYAVGAWCTICDSRGV